MNFSLYEMEKSNKEVISNDEFTLTVEEGYREDFYDEGPELIKEVITGNKLDLITNISKTECDNENPYYSKSISSSDGNINSPPSSFVKFKTYFENSKNYIPRQTPFKYTSKNLMSPAFSYYLGNSPKEGRSEYRSQPGSPPHSGTLCSGTDIFKSESVYSFNDSGKLTGESSLCAQQFNSSFGGLISTPCYNFIGYDTNIIQNGRRGWLCCNCSNFNYESHFLKKAE